MTSPDIHTLTGAYALDALDEFERRQFQEHVTRCSECAREVDELRATGAKLGLAVSAPPPETLRRKVMAEVAVTRQVSPPARHDSPAARAGAAGDTGGEGRAGSEGRAGRASGRADKAGRAGGTEGRAGRAGWGTRLTAVAAAVAAAAAVVLGVTTVRTGHERDAAQAQLSRLQSQYAAVAQLASAPDARGGSGAGARGGTAFVVASQQLNRAVLLVSGLPTPPAGHSYQAWLIGEGPPRSVGLVGSGASGQTAPLQFSGLGDASKFGLTIEPAGGSPQPTTTPVVLFNMPT